MIKHDVGIDAGEIWQLLSKQGSLSTQKIIELTGYKTYMTWLALGWLTRENKINFYNKEDVLHVELTSLSEMFY
jgi:hypothetical protein